MVEPTERVEVAFAGDGAGEDEMSWGQREIWISMLQTDSAKPVGGVKELSPETTVADIAEELSYLLARFQVMRTKLRVDGDRWPRQIVVDRGTIALDVVDAADDDPAGTADALCDQYREVPFDHAREWPVRMGVVRRHGVLTHMVVIMSHLVMDGFSGVIMMREVAERTTLPVTGMQPLEQARWQRSPAGARQNATALAYWKRLLSTMPTPWWGDSGDGRQPPLWEGFFDSPALLLAVRKVTQNTRADSATVLLTAYASALARVTGINPVAIRPMSSNRFRAGLGDVVAPVCQAGLCVLDVAGVAFDEALERVFRAATAAYKNAYVDPAEREELIAAIASERGREFDISCFFNDRRVAFRQDTPFDGCADDDIRAALARTTFRWVAKYEPSSRLYVQVEDVPDTIALNIFADTRHLSPDDAESLLRTTESILVEAALGLPADPMVAHAAI